MQYVMNWDSGDIAVGTITTRVTAWTETPLDELGVAHVEAVGVLPTSVLDAIKASLVAAIGSPGDATVEVDLMATVQAFSTHPA